VDACLVLLLLLLQAAGCCHRVFQVRLLLRRHQVWQRSQLHARQLRQLLLQRINQRLNLRFCVRS
jgi:hypothetical protein